MIFTYSDKKTANQAKNHFKNKGYKTKLIVKESGYVLFVVPAMTNKLKI